MLLSLLPVCLLCLTVCLPGCCFCLSLRVSLSGCLSCLSLRLSVRLPLNPGAGALGLSAGKGNPAFGCSHPLQFRQRKILYVSGCQPTGPVLPAGEKIHSSIYLALTHLTDPFQEAERRKNTRQGLVLLNGVSG